jgi:hypothetical protein
LSSGMRIDIDGVINNIPGTVGTTVPRAVCFSLTLPIIYLTVLSKSANER